MRRPVELGYFKGFMVANSEVVISHLQCMDDTLFIGKASAENLFLGKASMEKLWSIKVIPRWLNNNLFKCELHEK